MIKVGHFAMYKGLEYHLTCETDPYRVKIYTHDEKKIDSSFSKCNRPDERPCYEKYIHSYNLDDAYHRYNYAMVEDSRKLLIIKEKKNKYLVTVGYSDMDLVEKYQLQEVDRGVFEGWISKAEVQLVEEKKHVQY